jgi:hypothetical protein
VVEVEDEADGESEDDNGGEELWWSVCGGASKVVMSLIPEGHERPEDRCECAPF